MIQKNILFNKTNDQKDEHATPQFPALGKETEFMNEQKVALVMPTRPSGIVSIHCLAFKALIHQRVTSKPAISGLVNS